MVKRITFALLVAFVLEHAPWRLALLGLEVLVLSPGLTRVTQDDSAYWEAKDLESRLDALGWTVAYREGLSMTGSEIYGLTDPNAHTVTLNAELHWSMRRAVLAHEAGHVLQPSWLTRQQADVFAESVATLISRDGYREHARYLASYKLDFLVTTLIEWRAMYHAAAVLEDR